MQNVFQKEYKRHNEHRNYVEYKWSLGQTVEAISSLQLVQPKENSEK